MKKIILFVSTFLAFASFSVIAHDGSDHTKNISLTNSEVYNSARHIIRIGIVSQRLDDSWVDSRELSAEKIILGDRQQWLVKFSNKRIDDTDQQTLFIFLTLSGSYIDANFTGISLDK